MFGAKDRQRFLIVVTGDTGIGTLPAVRNLGLSRSLRDGRRGNDDAGDEQSDTSTD